MSHDIVARLRRWTTDSGGSPAVGLMDEAASVIESLRQEIRTQRLEVAALREERRAILGADSTPSWRNEQAGGGWIA
jgi:hypothetical protein